MSEQSGSIDVLRSQIEEAGKLGLAQVEAAATSADLESARIHILGKKGTLSEVLKGLAQVPGPARPQVGAVANEWKSKIEAAIAVKKEALEQAAMDAAIAHERIDVSVPSRRNHLGGLHPITQATRLVISILSRIGFEVATGPEAETDFLNFEAVNIPKDHPARDMQDTFFLGPGVVLRTHTTPVQMRTLMERPLPLRILSPGAVYRCDSDATHSPMFHQIEGLWVDRGIRMSDLKGVLDFLAKELFGSKAKIRLRPSYFPFVEPGAEVDVSCTICEGKNARCTMCKGTGWLEILGAGMVHPELYRAARVNAEGVTGFAFGMGVERIAMLLHGIPDLRLMFQGDLRFLRQFP